MSDEQNRAGWNEISARYQGERGWPSNDLAWGHRVPPESKLRVLGDVRGKRGMVLGCGGGQDVVALARLGAVDVVGVDISEAQLAHARAFIDKAGVSAKLHHGSVTDLSFLPEGSVDCAVSIHAMSWVERMDQCLAEVRRVLTSSGVFGMSVHHPLDAKTLDEPPYSLMESYFTVGTEWRWRSLGHERTGFRSYHRTVSDWFTLFTDAGFVVEKLLEPRPSNDTVWPGAEYAAKLEIVPGTLIIAARKR